jgi:hypothetical protein
MESARRLSACAITDFVAFPDSKSIGDFADGLSVDRTPQVAPNPR